jgi:thioredoxin 2
MSEDNIVTRCGHCGVKNRIPRQRLDGCPRCGKCGKPLEMGGFTGRPVPVSDATFFHEVTSHSGVVVVDCWAPWCGPCQMVGPVMDELASLYVGRAKIAKLNVDENPSTASQFAIQSIPTILFFKNGIKAGEVIGAVPKKEIENRLKALL